MKHARSAMISTYDFFCCDLCPVKIEKEMRKIYINFSIEFFDISVYMYMYNVYVILMLHVNIIIIDPIVAWKRQ